MTTSQRGQTPAATAATTALLPSFGGSTLDQDTSYDHNNNNDGEEEEEEEAATCQLVLTRAEDSPDEDDDIIRFVAKAAEGSSHSSGGCVVDAQPPPPADPFHLGVETAATQRRRRSGRSASPSPKSVTFADSVGRKLSNVFSFEKFEELDFSISEPAAGAAIATPSPPPPPPEVLPTRRLVPGFALGSVEEVRSRAAEQRVALETLSVADCTVHGSLLVANIALHKQVTVRYTLDHWATSHDLPAEYVSGCPPGLDRFAFRLTVHPPPPPPAAAPAVAFCCCFSCDQGQFWDNNSGHNYALLSSID